MRLWKGQRIMTLSEKLQALRQEKGFSQEQLAEKLDVSRQSVGKWESGQSRPDMDKLVVLAELFGVSTDYLLRGDGNPSIQKQNKPIVTVLVLVLIIVTIITIWLGVSFYFGRLKQLSLEAENAALLSQEQEWKTQLQEAEVSQTQPPSFDDLEAYLKSL